MTRLRTMHGAVQGDPAAEASAFGGLLREVAA
jgi:hypothetical protein